MATGIFSAFPAILRHAANEMASSQACVPPLAEVGRKECAASPICKIRPESETHFGFGFLHNSRQSTMLSSGVLLIKASKAGSQVTPDFEISFNASSAEMRVDHEFVEVLVSSKNVSE